MAIQSPYRHNAMEESCDEAENLMKKLHTLAFYVLVAPALTLGSGALLAAESNDEDTDIGEQSMGQDADPEKQSPEQDKEVTKSRYNADEPTDQKTDDQPGMQGMGHMESPPADGMAASDLIGRELKTSGDESVGEIGDLIIDRDGKVAAVLVNVGGFLGMGEKHVAIDWNAVEMSGNSEEQELRVDMTRDELESAPSYEKSDD